MKRNLVSVVGLGPGDAQFLTAQARHALQEADVLCGYTVYIDLVRPLYPEKETYATGMTREIDRCRWALQTAQTGKTVALVCSGDAGVYGMASPLLELAAEYPDVEVEVVPGLTAALSGAAVLGAPLAHDFCVISLSDRLTPWEMIEKRLACAAMGDFCVALYNPSSKGRPDYLQKAVRILLQNGKGAGFTFEPPHHTDRAVSKSDVKLLQSPESRDRVMEELGVELVLCPPFENFYNFSPEEFVREILKNCLNCRGVVCGEDYRFGKKGAGNVALLRELAEPRGIAVTALEPVTWKGETVSSSRILRCLLEGDTELAGELLGTPYAVCGKAVRRGEELCLRLPPEVALPAEGCYHGLDKTHGGRPVLLTVREGAIAWRGEATEQEPVELAFLGRG